MKFARAFILSLLPQSFAFAHDEDSPGSGKRHAGMLGRPCVRGCGCVSDYEIVDEFIDCVDGAPNDNRGMLRWADSTTSTGLQASSTSTKSNNCNEKGGPCDCDYIKDKNSDEYRQCLNNPDCERCYFTATWTPTTTLATITTTTTTPGSSSGSPLASSSTLTPSTKLTETTTSSSASTSTTAPPRPPDNCYVGGPCDCSLIPDKKSQEYIRCISNPACEHCFLNNGTLTTRSSTFVTQQTTLDITSTSSTT